MRSRDEFETLRRPKKGTDPRLRFGNPGYIEATKKAKAPQAVVKATKGAPRGARVRYLMDYVARNDEKDPLALEDENGVQHRGPEAVDAVYQEWSADFERKQPGVKAPRHSTHLILSADCENTDRNADKVLEAARDVARDMLGDKGYRYMLVMHRDTDHPHVHIVVNNYNQLHDRAKLRLNPPELLDMRTRFAERMRDMGLEQYATLRRDRVPLLEDISRGIAKLKASAPWYEVKIRQASRISAAAGISPPAFDAFAQRRQVARAVAKLKEQVKTATLPFTQDRQALLGELRQVERTLIDPDPDKMRAAVGATVARFGKGLEQFGQYVKDLQTPPPDREPIGAKDVLRRKREVARLAERLTKDIQAAREAVGKSNLPGAERAALQQQMKQQQRAAEKFMGIGLGR